jgi:PIN domain nuclease of toxin-antitoxin system
VRLLLDTCTFLWIASGSTQLSRRAAQLFADPANEVFLSAVSAWEIALKYSLGRLTLPGPPADYIPSLRERLGIAALPIKEEEALYLPRIPNLHRDPFDRLLVCQAVINGLALLTPDPLISQYSVRSIW